MKKLDFTAIYAIFKILSTSLGPKGLDKVIVNVEKSTIFESSNNGQLDTDDLIITNDGATIMKSLPITHPLGIILKQLSNSIDTKVGDGTTTGVILACKLIEESEKLLFRNYHPNLIIKAYTIAYEQCKLILNLNCIELVIPNDLLQENEDKDADTIKILRQIVSTSLSSKILNNYIEQFTRYCFEAVTIIQDKITTNTTKIFDNIQTNIKYIKLLGSIVSSKLIRGIIFKLNINNSNLINSSKDNYYYNQVNSSPFKVVLINFDIGYIDENSLKLIQYSNLNFNKREIIENEKKKMEINQAKDFINSILKSNNNNEIIIFSSKRISLTCLKLLQDNNIKTIFNLTQDQLLNIQLVTNSPIILNSINSINSGSNNNLYGNCNLNILFEKQSEYYIEIKNNNCKICTFLLKGPSIFIIEEIQRSLNDSISILSLIIENKKIISGGGSNEIQLSIGLERFLKSNKFKEIMVNENQQDVIKFSNCIKSFSKALEIIPILLINNAGYDSISLFQQLKLIHRREEEEGRYTSINLDNGKTSNMLELGIIESLKGKETMLKMIIDTVSMIIKIDQLIK